MTAEDARPWWASTDPQTAGLDADEDPIEVLRAARRPEPGPGEDAANAPDPDADHATSGAPPGTDTDADTDTAGTPAGADHASGTCQVCPLCVGWRLLEEHHPDVAGHLAAAGRHLADAQPEVAEHLGAAGRHLTAAFRKLIDERGEGRGDGGSDQDDRGGPRRGDAFEHIVLDEEEDQG